MNRTAPVCTGIGITTLAAMISPATHSQTPTLPTPPNRYIVTGTDKADVITVNDSAGVICGSAGVSVRSEKAAVLKADTVKAPLEACPGSRAGHQQWTGIDSKADNYFTGDFGDGDDRYTRIDGPGNDRYEYNAGPGGDVITSTDGPGDDLYLYNNGPGNDFSVHDNGGITASGNEYYRIDGGPGVDRTVVLRDGPGNDRYEFRNAESVEFNDFSFGDKDDFKKIDDQRND